MPPEARQKLKDKLQAIDDAVTRQELSKAIEAMLVFEKNLGKGNEQFKKEIFQYVEKAIQRLFEMSKNESETIRAEIQASCDQMMNEMRLTHESMMAECDAKMAGMKDGEDGMDGEDADEEEIIAKILPQLPKPKEPELTKKDKADLEAKIEELKTKLANVRTAPFIGPSRGVFLKINGVKQGIVSELNIVGSGVAITSVNGLPTVTITGGSGTTAVETPTGTVDGSNTSFTVANTPLYIIVDGVSKFATLHYTYAAGTITITDNAPPVQYIRSVFSA